jgi:uncharacterized protein
MRLKDVPKGVMHTRYGKLVSFTNPQADTIVVEDIAWALAHTCRFNGHCNRYYSVAKHSMRVAKIVDEKHKLAALLHDASEAYLGDIVSPLKSLMPDYSGMEHNMMKVIARVFGFKYPLPLAVRQADIYMLNYEWAELMMQDNTYDDEDPLKTYEEFLNLLIQYI